MKGTEAIVTLKSNIPCSSNKCLEVLEFETNVLNIIGKYGFCLCDEICHYDNYQEYISIYEHCKKDKLSEYEFDILRKWKTNFGKEDIL